MLQNSPFSDSNLLERYLAGELSPREQEIVQQWVIDNPEEYQLLSVLRSGITSVDNIQIDLSSRVSQVVAAGVSKRNSREKDQATSNRPTPDFSKHTLRRPVFWALFSSITTAIVLLVFGFTGNLSKPNYLADPVVMSTGIGHRSEVRLPDGSLVQLAPGTSLRYPKSYGEGLRKVELDGEAVFTVISNEKSPFVVTAKGVDTRVLGTTFGVRAYDSDSVVQVAVAQGRVKVGESSVLEIGDLVRVSPGGSIVETSNKSVINALSWTRNRLIFDSIPFHQLAQDISRWYGVEIEIKDSVLSQRLVTAHFEDIDFSTAMEILMLSLNMEYKRDGNLVTIYAK